jgi:large subunit ribosomal protein L6
MICNKGQKVSRIGKAPIPILSGIKVTIDGNHVRVEGPKGNISRSVDPNIKVAVKDNKVVVERPNDMPRFRALHGLTRSLLNNMVEGVTHGFSKNLEIVGVGYRVEKRPKGVIFNLGFSHPILFVPPPGIMIDLPRPTAVVVSGIDKELVGEVAAKIRALKPPEPYKGKGIRYEGEYVRRKAGKTAK